MEKLIQVRVAQYMTNDEIKKKIWDASANIITYSKKIQNSELDFFEDSAFEELEKEVLLIKEVKIFLAQPF